MPGLLPEAGVSTATSEVDGRLADQRRNLDALLQRYTDQHPDVISTRKLIKDLEEQKKRELAEMRKSMAAMPAGGGVGSPAAQELTKMLAAAEVQVAALKARVDEYSSLRAGAVVGAYRAAAGGGRGATEPRLRRAEEELRGSGCPA
jgi:uncharacterized protein involved in exopolysaccharide biosynthesis